MPANIVAAGLQLRLRVENDLSEGASISTGGIVKTLS